MHYFWSAAHCFDIDDPKTTDIVYDQINTTFMEDKLILQQQQAVLDRDPNRSQIDIHGDVASIQVRRMVARKIAEEGEIRKGATSALTA